MGLASRMKAMDPTTGGAPAGAAPAYPPPAGAYTTAPYAAPPPGNPFVAPSPAPLISFDEPGASSKSYSSAYPPTRSAPVSGPGNPFGSASFSGASPTPVIPNPYMSQPGPAPHAAAPPGQYDRSMSHQQHPGSGPPGAQFSQALYTRLVNTIRANSLTAFYPQPKLELVWQRAQTVDYAAIMRRWHLPNIELALDLASLALYDVVLFCDDSGSMLFQEDGTRIDDLKMVVEKVAEVVTLFDDDGIVVRFFNSPVNGDGICTTAEVTKLVSSVKFAGSTPLGERLYSGVLQPLVYTQQLKKPVLIITVTDGVPDNQMTVVQAIQACRDHMGRGPFGPHAVAFQFAQVGNDMPAMRWLATLDNHPGMGDIVDVTSNYEAESMEWARKNPQCEMTPGMWLLKMMLGSIDPQYDDKD